MSFPFEDTSSAAGGGGGGGDADTLDGHDSSEFLLLAGRAGAANNFVISTDDLGRIAGTKATAPFTGLLISATTNTTLGPFQPIAINGLVDTMVGGNLVFAVGSGGTTSINDDPGNDNFSYTVVDIAGDWEVGDDSEGGPLVELFHFSPTIRNPAASAKILGALRIYTSSPAFLADGAACTAGISTGLELFPTFSTANAGTLAVTNFGGVDFRYAVNAGATVGYTYGCFYEGPVGSGTVDDDDAFVCEDATATITNKQRSLASNGPLRSMEHAGPAMFGTAAGPDTTNGNILEVARVHTLAGNIGDGQAAGLVLDPGYTGAFTATRHNYLKYENPSVAAGAAVTDACVMWFDAAAGTHLAVDAHAGGGTPTLGAASAPVTGDPDAWVKINVNGTVMRMPAWA